jgi:hypothetical protein
MAGATVAVVVSRQAHPAALLLLSAAVVASGLVGWALYRAACGFFGVRSGPDDRYDEGLASELAREKMLTLRAIKELEFDHAMGKVSEADFAEISGRLRARALTLMEAMERSPSPPARPSAPPAPAPRAAAPRCAACATVNDVDAKFCKSCGAKL